MPKAIRFLIYAGALLPYVWSTPAFAVQQIFSCDSTAVNNHTTCTANCALITNITCDASDPHQTGITLQNHADIDMGGFTITCTGGACGTAIVMQATNSQVKNTGTTEAAILGNWSKAIDCAGYSGSLVEKLHATLSNAGSIGADGCDTVHDSVFECTADLCYNSGIIQPVTAENNYVKGFGSQIKATTSASTIDHNIMVTPRENAAGLYTFTNSTLVAVTGNVVFGDGDPIDSTDTVSKFDKNFCDPAETNCASCITAGRCEDPTAPFTFP